MRNFIERLSATVAPRLESHRTSVLLVSGLALACAVACCAFIRPAAGIAGETVAIPGVPAGEATGEADFVILALETGDFSTIERRVEELRARLLEGEAWWKIRAPDFSVEGVARELFRSADGDAWFMYLDLREDAPSKRWYPFLLALRADVPLLRISGQPYVWAYIQAETMREFILLSAIGAAVLYAVYLGLFREPRRALRLWVASATPALLTAAVFPIAGIGVDSYTVVAPACALAVGTAYAVHASRGLEELGGDLAALFATRGPVMALDWLTTVLGFMTLLAAPVKSLRSLGAVSIFGATVSFGVGLFVLPLLELPSARTRGRSTESVAKSGKKPRRRHCFEGTICAAVVLATALLALGLFRVTVRSSLSSVLLPSTSIGSDAAYIESRIGALDEVVLSFTTGREYGLVDLGLYGRLGSLAREIAEDPAVVGTIHYATVVEATLANLPGGGGAPRSDEEIGEALELFASSSAGDCLDMLVDRDWSAARVRIRLKKGHDGESLAASLRDWTRIAREAGIPEGFSFSGAPVALTGLNLSMSSSLLKSGAAYFGAILLILLIVLRSPLRAVFIVLPSMAGCAAALGLAGIIGWPVDAGSAFALSLVEGIGIDNALVFSLTRDRNATTIRSIIEATIVLLAILAAFLSSRFLLILQVFAMTATGLIVSTALVIFALPLAAARLAPSPAPGKGRI